MKCSPGKVTEVWVSMLYTFFMQTCYCARSLQPRLGDVMKKWTYSELLVYHSGSVCCLGVLIYFIAKVRDKALKCICKQTPPGRLQVEVFSEFFANISPGEKVYKQDRISLPARDFSVVCYCVGLRCWGDGGGTSELWWCKKEKTHWMEVSYETVNLIGESLLSWNDANI